MKIGFCLDVDTIDAPSGKHKFFIRLAKEFKKQGIKIDNTNPDIYISLPGLKKSKNAKVNVLRLDGLIMNSRWNYKKKNKSILKSISKCDAVVYQGEFCKKSYKKFLKVNKSPNCVIPNGASPEEFFPRNTKNYFLANCKWRPHKRLKDITKSFLLALKNGLDSDLIITGEADYVIKHPRIKYVGWQNHKQLKKMLSEAIASLHLTWVDWCPNAVVESIVSGCPIIYSEVGSHMDLAGGKNVGIPINDIQWDFKLCDLYDPPKINKKEVSEAMLGIKNKNYVFEGNDNLHIKNVAKSYIDFFNKLL
jgi:glycosyltransferase involved in cell wall biosynthesis